MSGEPETNRDSRKKDPQNGRLAPRMPGWVRWLMLRMMPERDVRMVTRELKELHAHWTEELGAPEADRRFLHQVRQYPFRLAAAGLVSLLRSGPWASPRSLRVGVRSLVRAPGLTSAIVLTVGVGIGGCTALFAVVDVLFLRPLPYPEPDELVWIYTDAPPNQWPFSVVDLEALREQQTSFESVAAYGRSERTLVAADGAERISTFDVTPAFFDLLGVAPLSGRTPTEGEGVPGATATALVTRGFAAERLGSARPDGSDALGATVRLDGEEYSVVGVLPPTVQPVVGEATLFPTLRLDPPPRKGPFFLRVLGRLRDEVDRDRAAAELRSIDERLFPLWADSYQDDAASWGMMDLTETLQGDSARLLGILMGAVGMLLLVAVANAANLLLARVSARQRELAVRRAMGASRAQVAGHLLTETLLLAVGGVVVGLLLARGVIALLPVAAGSYIPRLAEVHLGGTTLAFALVLAAGCGMLFGVVPLLHGAGGSEVGSGLRTGTRSSTGTVRQQRAQRFLVVAQVTVVVPLLTGAALLLSSFARLRSVDPGFEPGRLVTMRVSPSGDAFPDPETRNQFWTALLERLPGLPEVIAAGVASERPPTNVYNINNFDLEDHPTPPGQSQPAVPWIFAEPGYFETLDVPLVAGRMFDEVDRDYDPPVAIVDEAWAERFFPGEEVLGRRFRSGGCTDCDWTTVVGVVGVVPYMGITESGGGAVYQPDPQRNASTPYLFVRTRGAPEQVVARVRDEIGRLDRSTPISRVETGTSLLEGSLTQSRHLTMLLVIFSGVALTLAVVGLYGITAYSVEQRRGDIAVRLALGGSPGAVLRMVVGQGMTLTVVGLLAGTAAALGLTKILVAVLYEVSPRDPVMLGAVAVVLLSVSAIACLIPARRAVGLDPASALRQE